ncbi:helix-hairpin-helix domain-containing protein [Ralstonia insidiosa]|uniref:Helix-hairpin-helix domain-containing protein n=1 Tax=Ralstonia insidiosa TaxID=190721 RepID=A0A848P2T8_9RALS|nr:helix-hairpin-helix domain-containing protein [Ralstonia insidiosa]
MSFPTDQRTAMLALKGVGPTVIARLEQMGFSQLEQMGFSQLEQLRDASVDEIVRGGAALTGSTCWRNSPQARNAIGAVVALAKTW